MCENKNGMDEWNILRDIYQILVDGNVLNPKPPTTIVNFKFPEELMVIPSLLFNTE